MSPAELMTEMARLRVVVTAGADGRPVLDGIFPDDLLGPARTYRWLFVWGLEGAAGFRDATSGRWVTHTWHTCDTCRQLQLVVSTRREPRRCSLTPGCSGRMRPASTPTFRYDRTQLSQAS